MDVRKSTILAILNHENTYFCLLFRPNVFYCRMKRIVVFVGLFLILGVANAQKHMQYPLFIYSFTRYIQWPDDYTSGDFEILVLGDTPLLESLNTMAKAKKAGDRPIKVVRINDVTDIRKCNILFVPAGNAERLEEIMKKVGTLSILIITEEPGLGERGSGVNFIEKDGKLAFEMNQTSLTKHKLKAANELTRLAIII